MPPLLWTLFRCHFKQVNPACSVLLHKQKYISPKKKPMPYQHFNALRSSRLAYKYFTEKWNQMSPAGAYLVKVRVPVNNSHRKSTQGCPTRWRSRFISEPGTIILLPCHSLIHHSVCVLQTKLKFAQDFSKLLHGSFKKWIGFVKLLHIFLAQTHPFLTRILKRVEAFASAVDLTWFCLQRVGLIWILLFCCPGQLNRWPCHPLSH